MNLIPSPLRRSSLRSLVAGWGKSLATGLIGGGLVISATALMAQPLRTNSQRWLEVRQLAGSVTYRAGSSRGARVGDRFTAAGQGLTTGPGSSAVLTVDDGIGVVRVAENTDLVVTTLNTVAGGGKVTQMNVTRGQARLQVRRFNNPASRLEINTPAGVAAVRGTEFGVTVSDISGKAGISTREGAVSVSAQGRSVLVQSNQFSTIVPGQPPTPPMTITRDMRLDVQEILPQGNQVQITALTEAPNLVFVGGVPVEVSQMGQVKALVPGSSGQAINVLVRNPFGDERVYQILVP